VSNKDPNMPMEAKAVTRAGPSQQPRVPHQAARDQTRAPAASNPPINIGWLLAIGFSLVVVMFGGLGYWSMTAPLDSAVVAPGTIVVESNRKIIQHLEGGIVTEILVDEGDRVDAGDVLLRLDPTQPAASRSVVRRQLDEALVLSARLDAEYSGADMINIPESLKARLPADPNLRAIIEGQHEQFEERRRSLQGQVDILRQRIEQLQQEISGLQAQHDAQLKQREIYNEELVGLRELFDKGYYPRTRVLSLEREVANLEGEIGQTVSAIARSMKGIGEAELQIIQIRQQFREQIVEQRRDVHQEISSLREKLLVAEDSLDRLIIRAPLSGTVQELKVHTVGGVIRPGEPIMELVPSDDRLVVEAKIAPNDIEVVHLGMEAEVRLTALNLRTTPIILGIITAISRDRIVDPQQDLTYFRGEVVVPEEELDKIEENSLVAGMPADVVIRTGERTVMGYLVKPLTDYLARAFLEE
jgi:HlyD family secretion protein/epimerase transport system membrane fusion protein